MNISKVEQRVLHALAMGGAILVEKDERNKVVKVNCVTRDGWTLADCSLGVFKRLRGRRWVASRGGGPYRISRAGLDAVRAEFAQR